MSTLSQTFLAERFVLIGSGNNRDLKRKIWYNIEEGKLYFYILSIKTFKNESFNTNGL